MLEKWEKKSEQESFLVDPDLQSLTLNTFMRSILGIDLDKSESRTGLAKAFLAISNDMSVLKITDLIKSFPLIKKFTKKGAISTKLKNCDHSLSVKF